MTDALMSESREVGGGGGRSLSVELIILDQIGYLLFLHYNWQEICPNYHFLHHNSLRPALNYF